MDGDEQLRTLLAYEGPNKVLSLYLNTDLAHNPKEAVILRFRQAVKDIAGQATAEVARLERYLNLEYDWRGPGPGRVRRRRCALAGPGLCPWRWKPGPATARGPTCAAWWTPTTAWGALP